MHASISSDGQYCSQDCLLGLATDSRSKTDPDCPNAAEHRQRHLRRSDFISLIQDHLTFERFMSSCLVPLNVSGSRGSLFRLCLPSHGYVLLAKGVEQEDECHLINEAMIYRRLAPIQGKYIPVCIGNTTLSPHHPLIISGGGGGGQLAQRPTKITTRLLFVSYAGIPMERCLNETNEDIIAQGTKDCRNAIHALGVLHTDAFANNILLHDGQVRIIDFERSKTREKVEEKVEEEEEQEKEQERAKKQEQDDETIEEPSEWKEGEMSWWEFSCEKEIWSAVYPARTWLSVVGKIY